jgi:hypothetical protein
MAWPKDPFQPTNPSPTSVRSDRPRLIAPAFKWAALPNLIANDPYLFGWNASIFNNATQYYNLPPVVYYMDGSSGILDIAREVKMRIKAFAYVYRMTNDTKWVDRTWTELQVRNYRWCNLCLMFALFRMQQGTGQLRLGHLWTDGIPSTSSILLNLRLLLL